MKAVTSLAFFALVGFATIIAIPSFAQSAAFRGQPMVTPASVRPSDSLPATKTTTTTTTDISDQSWGQSGDDVLHNAELATEKGYNRAARDLENLALKGRVEAVLHENKSTRGSDVHVTADNGTVTLWGQLPSERRAQTVEQVVANVDGVEAVNNKLSYPRNRELATPPDSDSTGVAHPAYSDLAPAERAPAH